MNWFEVLVRADPSTSRGAVTTALADRGYEVDWTDHLHGVVTAMTFIGHRGGEGADVFVETRGDCTLLRFSRRQTSVAAGFFGRGLLFRGGSTMRHLRDTLADALRKSDLLLSVQEG